MSDKALGYVARMAIPSVPTHQQLNDPPFTKEAEQLIQQRLTGTRLTTEEMRTRLLEQRSSRHSHPVRQP